MAGEGYCKDRTICNSPTFKLTLGQRQKFLLFFPAVTDRFYPAKMSLGQNLERASPDGKIVRQSVSEGNGLSVSVGERTDEGQLFLAWRLTM